MLGPPLQAAGIILGGTQLGSASLNQHFDSNDMDEHPDKQEQRSEQVRTVVF